MHEEEVPLYIGDALFASALATVILKLHLEKSSEGFSAKTQGVYVLIFLTRYVDILFENLSAAYIIYNIVKKIAFISCSIYIVVRIRQTSKKVDTCSCNQDSFWVEALILPCIIITAVWNTGYDPEQILWTFSTYLEVVAMLPQLYLVHVRGKGDSYLPAYICLMALYSFLDTLSYLIRFFMSKTRPQGLTWVICKCLQLVLYIWYIFIPTKPVLPTMTCIERKRRPTLFMRQESLLAHALLQKKNPSGSDLNVYVVGSTPKCTPPGTPVPSHSRPVTPIAIRTATFSIGPDKF